MTKNSLQLTKMQEERVSEPDGVHRYPLPIPNPLYAGLQEETQREHQTMLDTIKQCLKIGLKIKKIQREPDTQLIVRRPGKPDEQITFY